MAEPQSKTSLGLSNDCSQSSVDYQNNANLTQQEKIELMDRALLRSLNKYEACQNMQHNRASSGSAGGATGAQTDDGNAGAGTSSASTIMTGSETAAEQTSAKAETSEASTGSNKDNKSVSQADESSEKQKGSMNKQANQRNKGSGRVPGDIPPVDNDSILETQIRQAAINESDPAIKAQLWNEYRKYKSLPLK